MLALKKMSPNKLGIYISIIVISLGAIGFLLYQNLNFTSQGFLNNAAQNNELASAEAIASGGEVAQNQPLDVSKIWNDGQLDLTIFDSEKFKALEENFLIFQGKSGLGKRDPFKPDW